MTIIIEDYVTSPKGLTKVFDAAGLRKFWFPVSRMPKNGGDWPTVADMIQKNQRLLVFTSKQRKEADEGIAYQWRYMVENQCEPHFLFSSNFLTTESALFLQIWCNWNIYTTDGNGGMKAGSCPNRGESSPMNTTTRSLVLVNYFRDTPTLPQSCKDNSDSLLNMVNTCYNLAAKRWPNFIAVDFYKVWMILNKFMHGSNY